MTIDQHGIGWPVLFQQLRFGFTREISPHDVSVLLTRVIMKNALRGILSMIFWKVGATPPAPDYCP